MNERERIIYWIENFGFEYAGIQSGLSNCELDRLMEEEGFETCVWCGETTRDSAGYVPSERGHLCESCYWDYEDALVMEEIEEGA